MLATENSLRKIAMISAAAALGILSGCTPPGPRALLSGDELLRDGHVAPALPRLEQATRLLPEEPRAWNLLGVAYHRSGQPQMAVQAYRQALAKDHSNVVAVAHYNLGCLLLEQNNHAGAVDELRSFTLRTNSPAGLVKLATAQLRLHQYDAAERNFNSALKAEPKNAEALNAIGVIHVQRQQRDAAQFFTAALAKNPKYAPALLNSAVLAQQNPATKQTALQRCRDFLAVAPQSPQAAAMNSLARALEMELAPPRPVPVPGTNAVANAAAKTNAPPTAIALLATNVPPPTSAAPRVAVSATNAKPPVVVLKTNAPVPPTNQLAAVSNAPVVATNSTAAVAPRPETNVPAPVVNLPVTVVTLTNPALPVIAPPEPVALPPERARPIEPVQPVEPGRSAVTLISPPLGHAAASDAQKKPGLFTRLNPFRDKPTPPPAHDTRLLVAAPSPRTAPSISNALPPLAFARYSYLSPSVPGDGNRRDAERAMAQGARAQRAGNTNEALLDYQLAVSADPSYFDGQYNLALLAFQVGDLKRSLAIWETVLALQPDSINARYNFALALKQDGFAHDSVLELQRILEAKPNEARAHLTLGNLYAQQLNEPEKARAHYAQVLELEPRNPQAAAIRFWLAANQ